MTNDKDHTEVSWAQNAAVPSPGSERPWLDPNLDANARYVAMWAAAGEGIDIPLEELACVRSDLDHAATTAFLRVFGIDEGPSAPLRALADARGVDVHELKCGGPTARHSTIDEVFAAAGRAAAQFLKVGRRPGLTPLPVSIDLYPERHWSRQDWARFLDRIEERLGGIGPHGAYSGGIPTGRAFSGKEDV